MREAALRIVPLVVVLWLVALGSAGCETSPTADAGLFDDVPLADVPGLDAPIDPSVDAPPPPTDAPPLPTDPVIEIDGRRILVDGEPIEIRGVCWSPVAVGDRPPADFAGYAAEDIALMRAAGINAVRTYDSITDEATLDALAAAGIWVLPTVYAWGGDPETRATERVAEVMDHPAVLMWLVGNEWNYNGLYTGVPLAEAQGRLERIAAAIHTLDPSRPVASVHGELPSAETLAAMPSIDVWGLNVYRGATFYDLFDRYEERSSAPMFVSEYGADAWDARGSGMENALAQADATRMLTTEILASSTARHADGVVLGGTIFEWSDEWWKDESGSVTTHDVGGVAPGGGPHPDMTFNEEWWGLVEVDRSTRPAYDELRALYTP